MKSSFKPLKFIGSSLDDFRNFPAEARRAAGFELHAVQSGFDPGDWKPMQAIGPGVREIRIHVLGEWRVIYVVRFKDAIYVLHAFKKKVKKRAGRISTWLVKGTTALEVNI